jgi:hypothetical protein
VQRGDAQPAQLNGYASRQHAAGLQSGEVLRREGAGDIVLGGAGGELDCVLLGQLHQPRAGLSDRVQLAQRASLASGGLAHLVLLWDSLF